MRSPEPKEGLEEAYSALWYELEEWLRRDDVARDELFALRDRLQAGLAGDTIFMDEAGGLAQRFAEMCAGERFVCVPAGGHSGGGDVYFSWREVWAGIAKCERGLLDLFEGSAVGAIMFEQYVGSLQYPAHIAVSKISPPNFFDAYDLHAEFVFEHDWRLERLLEIDAARPWEIRLADYESTCRRLTAHGVEDKNLTWVREEMLQLIAEAERETDSQGE